jgi:deoxyribodipyrimidine photo-lyase
MSAPLRCTARLHASQPCAPPRRAMPRRASGASAAAASGASASASAAASPGAPPSRVLLWFRNDLRLHDHACLAAAASACASSPGAHVVPVYCLDPRHFATTRAGHGRTGAFRAAFLLEALHDLRTSLRERHGAELLILRGAPETALLPLLLPPDAADASAAGGTLVLAHAEAASEELAVERAVAAAAAAAGGRLELHWGSTLLHPADLPFDARTKMHSVFTPFRTAVEGRVQPRVPLPSGSLRRGALRAPPAAGRGALPPSALAAASAPTPDLLSLGFSPAAAAAAAAPDERCGALRFRGGEREGLARLEHYLFGSDAVATYFDTRNGMLGADYSTKLSPWLAHGCVSPRHVAAELARYEGSRTKNKSTYWVVFELLWRDFFRFLFLRHGTAMFLAGGFTQDTWRWRRPEGDPSAAADFAAWKAGRTGWPLVDANMRELAATGFMSNRGRQNVASFLTQNLGLDWRLGAEYFEEALNDYDVCSNWGNWLFAAGVTGGRVNVFNIQKQSKDYDAQGDYVRAWLPELARVPTAHVHAPWRMAADAQADTGCVIGKDYPSPLPETLRGPASRHMGGGGGGGGGSAGGSGGGRRSGGGGGGGGGGRGGGRSGGGRGGGGGRAFRGSEFERYG